MLLQNLRYRYYRYSTLCGRYLDGDKAGGGEGGGEDDEKGDRGGDAGVLQAEDVTPEQAFQLLVLEPGTATQNQLNPGCGLKGLGHKISFLEYHISKVCLCHRNGPRFMLSLRFFL